MDRGAWWAAVHGVAKSRIQLNDFNFTFHFHALEKEMATHSSVLAWRIPGTGEPGGLPSMGSQRVVHDWSDLAAAQHYTVKGWLDPCIRDCEYRETTSTDDEMWTIIRGFLTAQRVGAQGPTLFKGHVCSEPETGNPGKLSHGRMYCTNTRGTAGWGHLTVTAREGHHPSLNPDKSGKPERHTGNLRLAQVIKNVFITY